MFRELPRVSAALLGFARLVGLLAGQGFWSHGVFGRRSPDGERSSHLWGLVCVWWEPFSLMADLINKCCCHIDWGMCCVASWVGHFCGDPPLACLLTCLPAFRRPTCLLAYLPTYPLTLPAHLPANLPTYLPSIYLCSVVGFSMIWHHNPGVMRDHE